MYRWKLQWSQSLTRYVGRGNDSGRGGGGRASVECRNEVIQVLIRRGRLDCRKASSSVLVAFVVYILLKSRSRVAGRRSINNFSSRGKKGTQGGHGRERECG